MHEVDCVIKDLDETNILEAALIENIQREDLNVIEAVSYTHLTLPTILRV